MRTAGISGGFVRGGEVHLNGGEKINLEDDSMGVPADKYVINSLVDCYDSEKRYSNSLYKLEGEKSTQMFTKELFKEIALKLSLQNYSLSETLDLNENISDEELQEISTRKATAVCKKKSA
jgi:hypothetical protein